MFMCLNIYFISEKHEYIEWLMFGYKLLVVLFSISIFLYGFFPLVQYENSVASMNDVPQFVEQIR